MLKVGDRVGVSKSSLDAFSWIMCRKPRLGEYARVHRILRHGKAIFSVEVEFEHAPGFYFSVKRQNVYKLTKT